MREEVISSGGTIDPLPAASSAGASSPAVPANVSSVEWSGHGYSSKAASLSCVGSQPPRTSLSTSAGGSTLQSPKSSCRPWEREDLLRRLASFKPSKWFGKPKVASPLACAQKGWMNIDDDKIACESCGANLSFVSAISWSAAEAEEAGEAFAKHLDAGHEITCPWKGHICPESLVQFPPALQSALIGAYKDRRDGLLQFQSLPVVAASAIEQLRVSRGPQIDKFLSQSLNLSAVRGVVGSETVAELDSSLDNPFCLYTRAQKLISLCGWEPRWLIKVQDCEERSAQSARDGCSFGPALARIQLPQDPGPSKSTVGASVTKEIGKNKLIVRESEYEFRSPMLDCTLCGATVRISDFLTVPRPACLPPCTDDNPDTSKKMGTARGGSAASGINGWVALGDTEKEQTDDRDEVATIDQNRSLKNTDVDVNLTVAGGFPCPRMARTAMSGNLNNTDMGRDLMIGQPSGSEVGDRAASYESRGPNSHKRSLEIPGSSDNAPHIRVRRGDSVGVNDSEVTDHRQFSGGPTKHSFDFDVYDTDYSPYARNSSGAGPSNVMGYETSSDRNKVSLFWQGSGHGTSFQTARDSNRESSVIAMDTIDHGADDDSMDSVENFPGDVDDTHFPSSSMYGLLEINDTSELNYSNHGQHSIGFQPSAEAIRGEVGTSSTNNGEELLSAEIVTAHAREISVLGFSGGSVGMGSSREAEIHGADVSIHRTGSVVGDVEPRVEDAENQGQTGESTVDLGLLDEIVSHDLRRVDPRCVSQDMFSGSVGRADSGSKVIGSTRAESVESGEKIGNSFRFAHDISAHPSLSCNANVYGFEATRNEVTEAGKSLSVNNFPYIEGECAAADRLGPAKGDSSFTEGLEYNPIIHHNQFCPWVNENVAAAGCSISCSNSHAETVANSGWQQTLDALDVVQSLGHIPLQMYPSESAASLYKDDHRTPGRKLNPQHSLSKSYGQF